MKRTGKYRLATILWSLLPLFVWGQGAVFTASVDKNPVGLNDVFTLKLTLENARGEIEAPDLSDFKVVFGPSRSSSYRIVNGQQSSSITFSYTLRPKQTGKFEIGTAKARVDGKVLTSKPIEIEVVRGSSSSTSSSSGAQQKSRQQTANKNLMVQIQLSRREAYKGQQLVATYILLSRYNNIDLGTMDFPTLDGFWTENLGDEQVTWEPNLEMVNGVPYRKAILRRQVLFPQRSGKLEIEPLELTAVVNRSFFNPGQEVTIRSNAASVNVKPLPPNPPESFEGAVGQMDFSASVDRTELKANEALNLKISIRGTGNLQLIDIPDLSFPQDFEVYDPETNDRLSVTAGGVKGSRNFQYLIIPRYPGEYTIPAMEFSYFDPATGRYETETAGPFNFKISDDRGNIPAESARRPKSRVEQSGLDIRYIVTDESRLETKRSQFFGTFGFWAGAAGPLVLLLAFLLYRRRQEALESDVVGRKRRRASSAARKRLRAAEAALKSSDTKRFYEEIFKAIYGYLGDKLGIETGRLSKPLIKSELEKRGVNEATTNEAIHLIETCEMSRFAPVTETSDQVFYKRTQELIENLDEKLK